MASSPAFVSAQDFFFSFDEFSRAPTTTVGSNTATGSVFIFRDENLDVTQLDLDFTNDNSSVVSFTCGVVFNDGAPNSGLAASAPGGAEFTSFDLLDPNGPGGITPTDGRLFATSFLPIPSPLPNPDLRPGANGVLLARVDFDVIGAGTANFDFIPDAFGIVVEGIGPFDPDFATGSITVEGVPEPSSTILLMLGATGVVARRRRS